MFTTNYFNYLRGISTQAPPSSSNWERYTFNIVYISPDPSHDSFDDVQDGHGPHSRITTTLNDALVPWSIRYNLKVIVGTSDVSPSLTDYKLGEDATSSFSNYSTIINTSVESGQYITRLTFGGMNSTSSAITLKEYGICKPIYVNYSIGSGNYSPNILFVHDLFETPIVVPANTGFTKTVQWVEE